MTRIKAGRFLRPYPVAMSSTQVIAVARDQLDRFGIHADIVVERRLRENLEIADCEGASFYRAVKEAMAALRRDCQGFVCGDVLQRVIDATPHAYLLLSPELEIMGANDAYLAATMTTREALLGRELFDALPDNPALPKADGMANLAASLKRVISTGKQDRMALQRYDVRTPDGAFQERRWHFVNTPVFMKGHLARIIHHVVDVTAARLNLRGSPRPAPPLQERSAA